MNASVQKIRDSGTFDKINNFVSLKDDEIKENTPILREVIEALIETMKDKDELFKLIYRRLIYTGSFWKGTKVGKPEEFDLDIVLHLPLSYKKISIEKINNRPGFARIKVPDDSKLPAWEQKNNLKILNQWIGDDKYLHNEKIRRWFEGIVSKSFADFESGDNKMKFRNGLTIKVKKSGPAFTLIVQNEGNNFSVDLVPVLEFNKIPPLKIPSEYCKENFCWYLVPKPSRRGDKAHLDWRYSFFPHEKDILKKNGTFKPVIRQIKKLRDTQGWSSIIPSYFIETLFFHEFNTENLKNRYPWSTNSYIDIFIHMLKKFRDACKNKRLNFFWDRSHNLFEDTKWDQIYPVVQRLDKIIKEVELKPSKLAEYVLTKEEFEKYETLTPLKIKL